MTPLGGFCALTLISPRLSDKAPEKITNKPQISASVVLLFDRGIDVCEFGARGGFEYHEGSDPHTGGMLFKLRS